MAEIDNNFIGKAEKLDSKIYRQTSHLGSTAVKQAITSMAHFKAYMDGLIEYSKQTRAAFDLGTAIHSVVLEQDLSNILVGPEVSTKAVKAWKDFVKDNPGREILTVQEFERVKIAFEAVANHRIAEQIISSSEIENSYFAKDPETGLMLKCRPDGINEFKQYMFDYKSTVSASTFDFTKAIGRFSYHLQAAHYIETYELATGNKINNFYFIAQEKSAPFAVNVIELSRRDIDAAKVIRRDLLNRISVAEKTKEYPAYSQEIQTVELPDWVYTQRDNDYAEVF